MTQRRNLYRRPSGIYVLRLTVPVRFRSEFAQSEIHVSTRTHDLLTARCRAAHLMLSWHSTVSELEQLDRTKLVEGGTLLAGKGLISVSEFSSGYGLPVEQVLRELLNHNIPIAYAANALPGFLVDEFSDVEREQESGGFVLNSAFDIGRPHTFTRYLRPFHERNTVLSLIEHGYSDELVFRIPQVKAAAFFDLPGIRLTAESVLISKVQGQKLLIAPNIKTFITPADALLSPFSNPPALATSEVNGACCTPAHASMTVAELLALYQIYKAGCKEATLTRIDSMVGVFISLTSNPTLGKLNRELIRSYYQLLKQMPLKRNISAIKHGTTNPALLIEFADANNELRMTENSVQKHMEKLSEVFQWAVTQQYLKENPAKSIAPPVRKVRRDQDNRDVFDEEEMHKIFSCVWFATGTDAKNKHGRFTSYRPHFYWLPLLGIYTGGRINELSQLYLDDFKLTKNGTAYISFNKNEVNKTDSFTDKSLKTSSSEREIPLHSKLIDLGLLDYVAALKAASYDRLFPELKLDRVKGYGKPASSWFNERLLGKQLGISRDGAKTFHSFRHMFISEIFSQGHPEDVASQLAGHERGGSLAARTYRKDSFAERMAPIVNALEFPLPEIQRFNITDGLLAIKSALLRKH